MMSFTKKSAESYPISIDYFEKLPRDSALVSATLSAVDTSDNSDATATVLPLTTATINGDLATFTVQAGTSGHKYKITTSATLNVGGPLIEELLMVIE